MDTIADLIHELTTTHKCSQSAIARATGIPQPSLSRWLNGESPTACDHTLKLIEFTKKLRKSRKPSKAQAGQGA
jgi:transcriptional regulator with XRE-family HTH domain